jgi:hypothetical protein
MGPRSLTLQQFMRIKNHIDPNNISRCQYVQLIIQCS